MPKETSLLRRMLHEYEEEVVADFVRKHQGNVSAAAKELGIGKTTAYTKLLRKTRREAGAKDLDPRPRIHPNSIAPRRSGHLVPGGGFKPAK